MADEKPARPLRDRPSFYRYLGSIGLLTQKPALGAPIKVSFARPWDQPNFVKSYLFSARLLLERSFEEGVRSTAIPVLYLQRHAFELVLKELLDVAYTVIADRPWLAAMREAETKEPGGATRVFQSTIPKSVRFEHNHGKLAIELKGALRPLGQGLHDDFDEMVEAFRELEQGDETRFRYPTVRGRVRSLGNTFEASLSNLQNDLETLVEQHYLDSGEEDPASLHEVLAQEADRMTEEMNRLGVGLSDWPIELEAKSHADGLAAVADVLRGWAFLEMKRDQDGAPLIEFDDASGKVRAVLTVRSDHVSASPLNLVEILPST